MTIRYADLQVGKEYINKGGGKFRCVAYCYGNIYIMRNVLSGWNESDVKKTFEYAKLRPYKMGTNTYEIFDAVEGQGFRRTEMARKFSECLKTFGYNAGVNYVTD